MYSNGSGLEIIQCTASGLSSHRIACQIDISSLIAAAFRTAEVLSGCIYWRYGIIHDFSRYTVGVLGRAIGTLIRHIGGLDRRLLGKYWPTPLIVGWVFEDLACWRSVVGCSGHFLDW